MMMNSRGPRTVSKDGSFLRLLTALIVAGTGAWAVPAGSSSYFFTTGNPDGRVATGSRPDSPGKVEIETADDFILGAETRILSGSFTGLLPDGFTVNDVRVEIYRVFPNDSTTPPDGRVPTRVNSPSDNALAERSLSAGDLSFSTSVLNTRYTAGNSVLNGVNPLPNQMTTGEGPVTGQEVRFDLTFTTPFDLFADHYFFIPQVQLSTGDFLWLSAAKPNVLDPISPDLQTWIRNADLDPDWLRVGTDIIGGIPATTYNAAFTLNGVTVPDGGTSLSLLAIAVLALIGCRRSVNQPPA